ncbi:MAG TPA: hypothetical protein VNI20_00220, partial [Fimbriimonadaceae bacterium]|nr:hypothetical protein [Fimbriimonadaceae bacterium]
PIAKPAESEPTTETSPQAKPTAVYEGKVVTPGMVLDATSHAAFTEVTHKNVMVPGPKTGIAEGNGAGANTIKLDFDRADVLKILESLAKQTNVNIISAPNVSPKDKPLLLTLTLNDVDLDFAMTAVTALADLRYTRIGNTYVVSKADEFASKIRPLVDHAGDKYETRVVDITSGEAKQIRDATLQAIPQDGPDGYYDIIDPTAGQGPAVAGMEAAGASSGATGGAANAGTTGAAGSTDTSSSSNMTKPRAKYVMLIGEPGRLNAIESYVRDLDARITESFSLAGTANYGTVVVPVASGQTQKIKDMLKNMLAQNPRKNDFSIDETSVSDLSQGEDQTKMLLIAGPKSELDTLKNYASSMDDELSRIVGIHKPQSPADYAKAYEVVDLMYIDPEQAASDLKTRVRGIYATVLPDPVTPNAPSQASASAASMSSGTASSGDATSGSSTAGASDAAANAGSDMSHKQMRLVLRGTQYQIDEAKKYLAAVDIPARQVAIELRVMDMTKEDALKLGLDWSILTGGRLTSLRLNESAGGTIATPGNLQGHYQRNATSSLDVLATLDSIANRNNLIARPNALITDGRSSHLFVGDTIRYIKSITNSQNGPTVLTDEVEVGVTVNVQARIGADGNIAFQLDQNFSTLTAFTPVPGGGALPQTSDRSTTMFVNMKDGDTIALGGLITDQDRKSVSGVPILKDIPLLGLLFSRTNNSKVRTEVVFFLTAKVVDNGHPGDAANPRSNDGAGTQANNGK